MNWSVVSVLSSQNYVASKDARVRAMYQTVRQGIFEGIKFRGSLKFVVFVDNNLVQHKKVVSRPVTATILS